MKNISLLVLAFLMAGVVDSAQIKSNDLKSLPESIVQVLRERIQSFEMVTSETNVLQDLDLTEDVTDAVVAVEVYKDLSLNENSSRHRLRLGIIKQKVGSGTGFFVSHNGYILTNRHVVADSEAEYKVSLTENHEVSAIVVYRDPVHDLAIMKVSGEGYPYIRMGDSSSLRLGQQVMGIGNALGQTIDSKSYGSISGLNRGVYVSGNNGEMERMRGLIQTSAKLYPGDSGGPLLNSKNEAVGVNVASAVGKEIGFSIPINVAKDVMLRAGVSAGA